MKEDYKTVELDVIKFSCTDVIVTSDKDDELQEEIIGGGNN